MLKSLRSIAKDERASALASSIRLLTESPFDPVRLRDRSWNKLIMDAAEKAGTSLSNATDRDFTNVRSVLADELRKVILPPDSVARVRERVGQKGLMKPSTYRVLYADEFIAREKSTRVSRREVEWVMNQPDRIDHLKLDDPNACPLTFAIRARSGPRPYWILAVFLRKGGSMRAVTAWKVPAAQCEYTTSKEIVELLKLFVEAYGADLEIGGERNRLFMYVNLPGPLNIKSPDSADVYMSFFARPSTSGTVELAFAYAINAQEYDRALNELEQL